MSTDIDLGWRLETVAHRLGGTLTGGGSIRITEVGIDSRQITHGALFVAIEGASFDGHDFAGAAIEAGACAVVVARTRCSDVTPRIEVDDTLDALKELAVMRRDELTMPVIAITGSTGKTSTKDLLAAGIEGSWASPRSFNNEIGVPLTVLATPSDASALIVEVGSRGTGHIRWLAPVVRPDVALVTNLGVVHLETFGTREGLADAKFELLESLSDSGTAIVGSQEHRLHRPIPQAMLTFGASPADVVVENAGVASDGSTTFTVTCGGARYEGELAMAGAHHAYNLAGAVGVCVALDMDVGPFVERLATARGSDWRMDVHRGAYTIVNDAYNANPQSVASGLATVAAMEGRPVAVLGAMAELGSVCQEQHEMMGELAVRLGFEKLIIVGADHGYALGARDIALHATDIDAARDTLTAILQPGDIVLIKASRSAGLERLALALIKDAAQ